MVKINISKQSNYPISGVAVRKFLQEFFKNNGIVSDAECHVSFVNETKMKALGKKYYRKDDKIHNVFSFVESEATGWKHPDKIMQLGEIVVCFPIVVEEAKKENKLIEEKVLELVGHSALHLLGIHHPE
ncbi:MAG: rRNA maturation RNase YbeY [Patescibacteria group bacterium]